MEPFSKRQTVTYIVRIWAEYLHEQPKRWCGIVESVGSGEKIHFNDLDQMSHIIQQKTDPLQIITENQK